MNLSRGKLTTWVCCALMIALIYSKFALTIGMILLLVLSGLHWNDEKAVHLNPELKFTFKKLWHRKDILILTLFFIIPLISGLWSSDMEYWLERLRIKLPFLILPFALVNLPKFSVNEYRSIFYTLILTAFFSTLPLIYDYLLHMDQINEAISRGKPFPTPMNHIRYSLILAFACLAAFVLFWKKQSNSFKWESKAIGGLALFLFLFLHLLSVRSGLLVLYLGLGFLVFRWLVISRRFLMGSLAILLLIGMPFIAYQTVPSLQKKVGYALYDIDQFLKGNAASHSDGERMTSIKAGLEIGLKNPVVGVGAGDVKQEISDFYKNHHPKIETAKLPHNQLISIFAGTGFVGLVLFLLAFFYPLFYTKNHKQIMLSLLHLIVFTSFLFENTVENAIGVAFYILLLGIELNKKRD